MKNIFTFIFIAFVQFSFAQNENQHANMNRKSSWQKNSDGTTRIEVTFENPEGNSKEIQIIKNAVLSTWGKYANIQFTNWGKSSYNQRGIRILINHIYTSDMNIGRPHTKGLGNNLDGVINGMELNPEWIGKGNNTNENCLKFTTVHEFEHALGLAHEQNRTDYKANCNCYQALEEGTYQSDGGGGDYYVTPCDENSIMNYCNKNWNNGGELSYYDIIGIQTVYGKNSNLLPYQEREHITNIVDNIGNGQTWENLYIVFGDEQHMLHVDGKNINDISKFYNKKGNTYYKVWSKTFYSNGTQINGFGEGYVYIQPNSSSIFEVFIQDDRTKPDFGELTLQSK